MKITAKEVKQVLEKKYSKPEYEIFFEVSSSTGNGNSTRYADAVSFNTFSSRGYKITGFEIKVNRNDLLKELKSPEKAENELDIIERQMKYNIEYYRKQIEKLQKLQENLIK